MSCGVPALERSVVGLRAYGNRSEPCLDFVFDTTTYGYDPRPVTPDIRPLDPVLNIACDETISSAITRNSAQSLYRTSDLVSNLAYSARRFVFHADDPGVYVVTVSNNSFSPFLSVVRSGSRHWQTSGTVLTFNVALEDTGPMVLEVSTVAKRTLGTFDVHLACPTSFTPYPVKMLAYPGTVGEVYYTLYGPRVSVSPVLDKVQVLGASVWIDPFPDPDPTGPFVWSATGLPPGLSIIDSDPSDLYAEIVGTPTTAGTYAFTIEAKKDGVTIGSGNMTIQIVDSLTFDQTAYLVTVWSPFHVGVTDGKMLGFDYAALVTLNQGAVNAVVLFMGRLYSFNSGDPPPSYFVTLQDPNDGNYYFGMGQAEPIIGEPLAGGFFGPIWKKAKPGFTGSYALDNAWPGAPATVNIS